MVYLLPALVSALVTGAGVAERRRDRPGPVGITLIAVPAMGALALLAGERGPGVPTSDFVLGLAVGGGAGLIAGVAYYALGVAWGDRSGALTWIWLLTQLPFAGYAFVALFYAIDLVHCGPDAYECPL